MGRGTLDTLWQLIDQVWRLDIGGLQAVVEQGALGARLTLILVLLVGLSEAVGESVVLFLNRVKLRRFFLSLVFSAVLFAFSYVLLVLSIYHVPRLAFDSVTVVFTI